MTLVELKKNLRNRNISCEEKYTLLRKYYMADTLVLTFGAYDKHLSNVISRYFRNVRERTVSRLICAAFERREVDVNDDVIDLYNDIKHDIYIAFCWLVNYKNKLTTSQVAEFIAEHTAADEHGLSKRLLEDWGLKLENVVEVMTEEQRVKVLFSGYKIL